jgi:hypothetical protein
VTCDCTTWRKKKIRVYFIAQFEAKISKIRNVRTERSHCHDTLRERCNLGNEHNYGQHKSNAVTSKVLMSVGRLLCKASVTIVRFYHKLDCADKFYYKSPITVFMQICPVGVQLFHADTKYRRMDKYDEVDFRNCFANAPKNKQHYNRCFLFSVPESSYYPPCAPSLPDPVTE